MKDKNERREYFASTVAKTMIKHSGQSVKNLMQSNAFDQEVGATHLLLFSWSNLFTLILIFISLKMSASFSCITMFLCVLMGASTFLKLCPC
jgi:succinate-acetate transporter protein